MPTPLDPALKPDPRRMLLAWAVAAAVVAGVFVHPIGVWALPILGAWFIGAQKPLAGALWLVLINLGLSVLSDVQGWIAGSLTNAALRLAALAAGVVPLILYRLLRPRRFPLLAGLCLPLAANLIEGAARLIGQAGLRATSDDALHLTIVGLAVGLWIHEADWRRLGLIAAAALGLAASAGISVVGPPLLREIAAQIAAPAEVCVYAGSAAGFGLVILWTAYASRPPKLSPEALAMLRSPGGGEALRPGARALTTPSGLRFPIKDGFVSFAEPQALGGMNARLNRLYAQIASLYDDIQRLYLPLRGQSRDAYMAAYLAPLEIRAGDKVLETSIGTGANFRLLRQDIQRFGLDLSSDMLAACRDNFGRWGYAAALVKGNAEALPFADESFDVVFHVGGINFFNDRAKAIAEMIRVAKPGSLLLIADETEKHVKGVYEAVPVERGYFQGRQGDVAAPVDLVPSAMQDVRLKLLRDDSFYVLTFRKPLSP
jgi:ubiquinone/menaquinone biosynthesis C-methylase UbiE